MEVCVFSYVLSCIFLPFFDSKEGQLKLLDIFWRHIDPTDDQGQFGDRGESYKTVIFYHDNEQKKLAERSKKDLDSSKKFNKKIVTKIKKYTTFFPSEDYHQDYFKKNPLRYKLYRMGSGRDNFINEVWGN